MNAADTSTFNRQVIEKIKSILIDKKYTLAVSESATGGLLQAAFTQVTDASSFFHGGITVYNLGQKARHLKINSITAEACNCVASATASEMAESVTELFSADIGLSLTGYVAPLPEKNVDNIYAYCAGYLHGKPLFADKLMAQDIAFGLPAQFYYVNKTLEKLLKSLA